MSQLTTTMLADYLRPLITSGPKVVAGRLPDMPNRCVAITKSGGPGLTMDGLFDVIVFIIQCRGGENNIADSETISGEIDDIFLGKHPIARSENFLIGDFWISQITRVGGGPTQLALPDSQSRWTFSCNYLVSVSTDVGTVFNG
jgi:hypothetical protein